MDFNQCLASIVEKKSPIGVVGLGYVGLPLSCLFASKYQVVAFDISAKRVDELKSGFDRTGEVEKKNLNNPNMTYTTDAEGLKKCPVIIVTVPTPVDEYKKPDLGPMISASQAIGKAMSPGTVVVYESTVFPGVTEKICKKYLEDTSGLKFGKDFFLGYSPERVNPGDKLHTIDKIKKVVAGSSPEVTEFLATVYGSVIQAGIHKAPTIMTAEAAKVIENTQRDINIALINELSQIFDKLGLDTLDVLEAAKTKWNFLDFRPGLVGGHCIGVDPYYLTYLSESLGIHPQVILSGRRINDGMGAFIADKTLKMILRSGHAPSELNVAVLGVTFKENVPDLRNTKVMDVVDTLESFGVKVHLVDPIADKQEFFHEYKRHLTVWEKVPSCDAIVLAVKHDLLLAEFPLQRLMERLKPTSKVLVDIKGIINRTEAKKAGAEVWRP